MITLDDILDAFFEILKNSVESVTLPTGKNFVPTFLYSLAIFAASITTPLLGYQSFVDWRGALLATVLLIILAIIERRDMSEVSRLYRVVKSGATALKSGAKRSGSTIQTDRDTDAGDAVYEEGAGCPVGAGERERYFDGDKRRSE